MSMFGALNRFISRLDSEPQQQASSQSTTRGAYGFQVLRNTNVELPIEPWFDFIIGINGRNIDSGDQNLFVTEVRNCAGSSIELGIWSAKGQRIRSIYAAVPHDGSSLGLALQWTPLSNTEDVWHVLDVIPNSPADAACLLPYGDYIIGSPEGLLKGESGLGELVEDYLDQPLRLYIYNHEFNVAREVTIQPSRNWGGNGALGCVLGYGALHRIPASLDEPPQAPGETLFETARLSTDTDPSQAPNYQPSFQPDGQQYSASTQNAQPTSLLASSATPPPASSSPQFLVPVQDMPGPPRVKSPGEKAAGPAGRKAKKHHEHRGAAMDMDAFFQEGEQKSREQDHAPSPKPGGAVAPPPPKADASGGPPRAG